MYFVDLLIKSENISTASNLQVLFKDPVNGDGLNPLPSKMEDDSIQMKIRPNSHFKKWGTTISLFENVKGDPKGRVQT